LNLQTQEMLTISSSDFSYGFGILGGAISMALLDQASSTIANCTFTSNIATVSSVSKSGLGGAIYIDNTKLLSGTVRIHRNTYFLSNSANQGGAIYFSSTSGSLGVFLEQVHLENNIASSKGHMIADEFQ